MSSDPYQEWISLFTTDIKNKWEEERTELKKISMLYCAFQNELNRIKTGLNDEVSQLKSELKQRDYLRKCKSFSGLAQSEPFVVVSDYDTDKENETPKIEPLSELNLNDRQFEELFIESPDTNKFFDQPRLSAHQPTSPVFKKNTLLRGRSTPSPSLLFPVIAHKIKKTPILKVQKNDFKTPNICDETNILESTIIEDTPDVKTGKRSKLSMQTGRKRRKKMSPKKQNSTLTQMFLETKNGKEINSDLPSMSINEMLQLINKSGSDTDAGLSDDGTISSLDVGLDKKANNLTSFVTNYDKLPEKKVDEPDFAYNEVVRGKERKKLKGWSCRECEDYYKGLNLPPDELEKKKDNCSKHRNKFKPREETYQGFWDLTFGPTPKTQS